MDDREGFLFKVVIVLVSINILLFIALISVSCCSSASVEIVRSANGLVV